MTLIPQWRQAWRFFSVQAQTLALAMIGAWQMLPDRMQAAVPDSAVFVAAMVLLVLGIVGRLIAQPGITPPKE